MVEWVQIKDHSPGFVSMVFMYTKLTSLFTFDLKIIHTVLKSTAHQSEISMVFFLLWVSKQTKCPLLRWLLHEEWACAKYYLSSLNTPHHPQSCRMKENGAFPLLLVYNFHTFAWGKFVAVSFFFGIKVCFRAWLQWVNFYAVSNGVIILFYFFMDETGRVHTYIHTYFIVTPPKGLFRNNREWKLIWVSAIWMTLA